MPERFLVTSALPYANGPIHFGHVAGAYLPADIFVRYKRLNGAEVLYICGTDEHGAPIQVNAEKEGKSPREYADHWHEVIARSFARLDIGFDHFSRTSREIHHETTRWFFQDLLKNGFITTQTADQLYCETCKHGLPDRYVEGTCPLCKFERARGDECPKCGGSFEAVDLIDPRCKTCGNPASRQPATHWYLDLPALRGRLAEYHEQRFPRWRPNVVGEVQKIMNTLRPRAITRDLSWGIQVPLEEAAGKVFYVWFDAPIGYVSSTREWAREQGLPDDAWKEWWQRVGAGERTRLVHFIGKDNIAFHAVIFPGMLLGQDAPYLLPDVPANEFLNLEGDKFSTSGGWFISIDEFCERYPSDALRWTLARSAPETKDSEFTWKDFQTKLNTELLGTFANFASRVLKFVHARFEGTVPAAGDLGEPEVRALEALATGVKLVGADLDDYSPRNAALKLLDVGYAANKLIDETVPFKAIKDDPQRAATTINVAVRLLEGLAILLTPFIPGTAARLWRQLGLPGAPTDKRWDDAFQPPDPAGRKIGEVQHLFQRLDDEQVAAEVTALKERAAKKAAAAPKKPGGAPAAAPAPAKPEIEYEQFAALDIRIARVVSAEAVPKADKLLKLELDVGGERRTVVSGIKAWYRPEDLVGKQVTYLANLKPRKLRGILSQGMVLAANDTGNVAVLLHPEREVPDGAQVS